jgi:hypothetical protein
MLKFYEARDSLEARQVVDALAAHRIRATVLGEFLAGAVGELPAMNFPWVWLVDDEDLARARAILDDLLASRAALPRHGPWVCAACGADVDEGFDVCWQCGRPRP